MKVEAPPADRGACAPGGVEAVLDEVGRTVRRAMLDAIPDGEPHTWLYRVARSDPSRPGKALRPALCLATCRAFGARDPDALPLAVAIEMLHNAFPRPRRPAQPGGRRRRLRQGGRRRPLRGQAHAGADPPDRAVPRRRSGHRRIAGAALDAFARPGPDTDFVRDLVPYVLGCDL